ncbi:hypothetical protein OESDEN_08201 [Oesophagostomum dentatum]|uniref:Secreted protein n=1 Tax=Oesophagostomum dentatum TaxID=61180 RepID=A0A0B1T2X0_OESDE|nr:hypothetical protein OESDEN_08201 [Oesophagostomum dentatum]
MVPVSTFPLWLALNVSTFWNRFTFLCNSAWYLVPNNPLDSKKSKTFRLFSPYISSVINSDSSLLCNECVVCLHAGDSGPGWLPSASSDRS